MINYIARNSIKLLIIIKVAALVFVALYYSGFYLDDKSLLAEDEPEKQVAQAEAPPAPAQAEEEDDEDVPKSYMEDLFTLPKIDKENLEKDEIARYLSLLEKKSSQVESRINVLSAKEKHLKELEGVIDDKLKKLEEEMGYFQTTVQKEKDVKDERLEKLVEFYRKMTPKKAAPVFESLDKDLVVALFNKIPQKQTTEILSLMNPQKSVELSEYFGRIKSGSEYNTLREINTSLRKEFSECREINEQGGE
jgi:flagellar motility protein MotE (MotC chaperone)